MGGTRMTAARYLGLWLVFLLAPFTSEAQQVKLRLTSQLPNAHHIGISLVQFRDEVERRTDKTVTVEIFDNSRLYKDNQVVGAVSSGAIDMGLVAADQFVDKVPGIAILQQPFLFNFYALVKAASDPDREMRPLLDKAILDATGARVLLWLPFGSTVILSKQQPTLNPSEISKQKVRVLGKTHAAFIEQCGGIAAIIAAGDQLAAVQDGRVDMLMTGVTGVPARQLWKVTDTITRTEHATFEMLVIIQETVWQRLSEGHRTIVGEVARKVEQKLRDEIAQIEDNDYRFAREKGMKVFELTPDQVAEWRACSAPVLEAFMMNSGELAHQLMWAYGKLRTDPCCSTGPQGLFTRR
jgi:C4-dicarboxylate-binding protein DctP